MKKLQSHIKKRRQYLLTCLLLVVSLPVCAQLYRAADQGIVEDFSRDRSNNESGGQCVTGQDCGQRCTMIYASDGEAALAGNNEDYKNPFGTIWFLPAEEGKFGRVYLGWRINGKLIPQGGMNDQGLFYDGATAEVVIVPRDTTKPRHHESLIFKAMEECSTVEEVLKLFETYDVSGSWNGHYLIGDRFGHSAIIEPQNIIRKEGRYQIVTNFFQSKTKPEDAGCTRYQIASKLFEQSDKISVDLFRRILNAVHWEEYSGSMTVTLYSNICDLKNGDIYIYHFHNFEDVVRINLQEELKKGERYQSIVSLFPYETFASKRYHSFRVVGMLYKRVIENGLEGDEGAFALFQEMYRGDYKDYHLSAGESHLNSLGYELLEKNRIEQAIQVFQYAVSQYPESSNVYDSLGEAYLINGDKELAIKNYRKSLELEPGNDNAKAMLKKLQE